MSFSSIPPLLSSKTDPVILGLKKLHVNNYDPANFSISSSNSRFNTPEPDSVSDAGSDHHATRRKYAYDQLDHSSRSRLSKFNSQLEPLKKDFLADAMLGNFQKDCQIKQIGSSYVVIKKEESSSSQDIFQFGSHSTLPGVIGFNEHSIESLHRKQTFANHQTDCFWNAKLQLNCFEQSEKFLEYCRHFLIQIRKFISKLQQAIISELNYVEKLSKIKLKRLSLKNLLKFGSNDSLFESNSSENFASEEHEEIHVKEDLSIRPPKLGKVYSELQIHFKAWVDIMQKWNLSRQHVGNQMLPKLLDFHKRIKVYENQMLSLTQKLIESRLHSFACCAALRSKNNYKGNGDWDSVLGAGCLKRFCKLIDSYNKILSHYQHQKEIALNMAQPSLRSLSLTDAFSTSNTNSEKSPLFSNGKTGLQFFNVARILNILVNPAKDELADTLLGMLNTIQQNKSNLFDQYETEIQREKSSSSTRVDWAKADHLEVDEDQVITNIAGFEVDNISNTKLSNDSLSSIKQLLYAQGSFIVTFMNNLAGNTSLLRGKMNSKSPRSVASSLIMNDESLSSDDDVSSVASLSFFSQLSGTSTSSPKKRKTVLWRDSWDQEAVKSLSKSYMANLVTEGPSKTLLAHSLRLRPVPVTHMGSERDDDSGVNDQIILNNCASSQTVNCFRSRFWSDSQAFTLDASILNMMTLEILPEDVLQSVQESTQYFIIEKALERWDCCMYLALGISVNDKCGSLPIDHSASLSKTGWTYIRAIHALMFIMDRYNQRDDVAQEALPRLETTLSSFYLWCQSKIQQFLSSWSLRQLMQVSMSDLSQVTTLGLECLSLVEKCHNHVESKRVENPATLQLATKHLKNIDGIITDMQTLSGNYMRMYIRKCSYLAKFFIEPSFPSSKLWRQNNLTDHSCASAYMEKAVDNVLAPICSAVAELGVRCQLTAVPHAVSAILDAVICYIRKTNIRFSVQGAMQLQRDFEYLIEYVCSDEAKLNSSVRRSVQQMRMVKRAMWIASTLQRTDLSIDSQRNRAGYERSRRNRGRSITPVNEDPDIQDDSDWSLTEKDVLAMRIHQKGGKQRKRWFSLPCSDDVMD